ncbi:MAG: metallophosphoesterase family protein [Ancalomicrobiaceae bacterium]|nr:metallophosphoesterase family protein [Ancalomicrobiaceae bacterium]
MRLAVLTDIHGNAEALDACLEHIASVGVDGHVILGDIVGYGPDPGYVVERVMELQRRGAVVLLGNHDEAIADGSGGMSELAAEAIGWTREQLTDEHKAFLAGLPLTHQDGNTLFVHASARDPGDWNYVIHRLHAVDCFAATDARRILCGHTHRPILFHQIADRPVEEFVPKPNTKVPFFKARRYLAVIGSVGQPRDHNPNTCWALLEPDGLTLNRIAYDIDATARKIAATRLPRWLGLRLYEGR